MLPQSIARPTPMQIPQASVVQLARTLAQCRHDLPGGGLLVTLPLDQQTELKAVARLLIDPNSLTGLHEDIDLRLRKALAQHVHGSTFERLHEDDREEIATEANLVLGVVLRVLAGEVQDLPDWERQCLRGELV